MRITDVHAHYFPPGLLPLAEQNPSRWGLAIDEQEGQVWYNPVGSARQRLVDQMTRVSAMLEEMDRQGVSQRVISLIPTIFHYEADRDTAVTQATLSNDEGAALCAQATDRLRFLAHLPMAYPDEAAREAVRAVRDLGAVGVQIGTTVCGVALSDQSFTPVWRVLADLGVPVLVHPIASPTQARAFPYYLGNTAGHPIETALAASLLVLSGRLAEYPSLRLILAHGGGALPLIFGRIRHGWTVRPEARRDLHQDPINGWSQLWFDSITHDPQALKFLVSVAGPGRVLLGSDAPFDMGVDRPVDEIKQADLGAAAQADILTAGAHIFGLM